MQTRRSHLTRARASRRRLFSVLSICVCVPLLGACASVSDGVFSGDLSAAWSRVYLCEEGGSFSARIFDDLAIVTVDGRRIEMEPAPDGRSGGFTGEGYALVSEGSDAGLRGPSGSRTGCELRLASSPWEDAAHRGVTFRGIGQEPGWYVEVVPDRSLLYVGAYGEDRILAGAPIETPDPAHARTEFRSTAGERSVLLLVVEARCVDVMSGEGFPARATVTVDGTSHHGCGQWLSP